MSGGVGGALGNAKMNIGAAVARRAEQIAG
jgi:hypothetical protein